MLSVYIKTCSGISAAWPGVFSSWEASSMQSLTLRGVARRGRAGALPLLVPYKLKIVDLISVHLYVYVHTTFLTYHRELCFTNNHILEVHAWLRKKSYER